jgi:hypothetical protein
MRGGQITLLSALVSAVLVFPFCSNMTSTSDLLDANFSTNLPLTTSPRAFELLAGESQLIKASGGQKPYKYKIFAGVGSVSAAGLFTSSLPGLSTIQVDDSSGLSVVISATVRSVTKDPASLTSMSGNLRLWLKADALALADGNAVSAWPDSSGNGVVVSQGTAANQPMYKSSVYNGKPAVRFNGVAAPNSSQFTLNLLLNTNDMTIFLVATPSSTTNAYILTGNDGSGGPGILSNWVSRAYEYYHVVTGNVDRYILQTTAPGLNLMIIRQTGTTNLQIFFNSALQLETNPANGINGHSLVNIGFNVGSPYGGDIAEFIVYNAALSPLDRYAIECYLVKKYNLSTANICQ